MKQAISLSGAVVAVTGGARGIGLAIAEALTAAGARVSIGDIDIELAQKEATRLGAFAHRLDVRQRDSFAAFIEATRDALGPVDVLVNNAGIMPMGSFLQEDPALSDAQIDINFRGVIIGMQAVLPDMLARGRGHIINVASLAGRFAIPGAAIYCGTKSAVIGLTETVAAEFRESPVNFTAILPSAVSTELTSGTSEASRNMLPVVTPEQVAEAVTSAIHQPRPTLAVPAWLTSAHVVYNMVPNRLRDWGRALMDDQRLLTKLDHAAHAGYDRRIAALAKPGKG